MTATVSKKCRRCGKTKPCSKDMEKSAFYQSSDKVGNPDGYRSYCKPCGKAMSAAYAKAAAAKPKGNGKAGAKGTKAATKGKAKRVGTKPKGKAVRKATKAKGASGTPAAVPASPLVHEEAKA